MNPRDPRLPFTDGHHREYDTPDANNQSLSSGGTGWSYSQPGVTPYQQAWRPATSAGPGQSSQHRSANSGGNGVRYEYSYYYGETSPTAPGGFQNQSYGWQSNSWQQGANGHGNPLQTTEGTPTSLGTAAPTMTGVASSNYNDTLSTYAEPYPEYAQQTGFVDDRIECPYRCGTVLTGIHAVGNLTRHLKSKACPNSPKSALRHICPIYGCEREYARSDGLKVHMRRHHGAPPAAPKYGAPSSAGYEEDYDAGY